ncbi:GNAT family N-acetyltransferase [Corallococcus macrosporus]|uniref:Acetyltransferase n=1 Tax=Myxococcus fulvus (strain ATCC BAA-855 / HW-1) TaxID=483219 RepID=F8CEI0_MYXFH|nr:GNAT family N-acetyltransferase [Corallococcus macrosporus]AEI66051.1 acetyltransferase [Corallococcus macrosporus]
MQLAPASDLPPRALSTLFARAFEGYFVPVPDAPALFDARVRGEHISLEESRVARVDGEPVGLVLMARRGRESRVAGMGVVPAWRNRKLGGAMLRPLLDEARARGDARVVLEVIEQNAPAVALYERLGFQRVRRLVGFMGTPEPLDEAPALEEVAPWACARWLPEGLPWQLAPATVMGLASPARAFRLGPAVAVVADVAPPTLVLRSISVEPSVRGQGVGRKLLRALAARWPGKPLAVSAIVPEGPLGRFFLGAGLAPTPLTQLELSLPLAVGGEAGNPWPATGQARK